MKNIQPAEDNDGAPPPLKHHLLCCCRRRQGDNGRLQLVICSAEKVIGNLPSLQDLDSSRTPRCAGKIVADLYPPWTQKLVS